MTTICRFSRCGIEIPAGKGRYRTGDGYLCPTCVSHLSPTQRRREDIASREWELRTAKRELALAEDTARASTQATVGKLLFPLAGPRRQTSISELDRLGEILAKPDSPARINELLKILKPAITRLTGVATNTEV